ncbi:MAG: hypothetical protein LBC63_08525 [Holophagales bacterium]|nr:hypothetical protein [Holophagales bacterium]
MAQPKINRKKETGPQLLIPQASGASSSDSQGGGQMDKPLSATDQSRAGRPDRAGEAKP